MERRHFMKACAAAALAAPDAWSAADVKPRFYSRARLVDEHGRPLRAAALAPDRNYVFHYPFEGTPCFLLNLGKPARQNVTLRTEAGGTYEWPGGVGPQQGIVA